MAEPLTADNITDEQIRELRVDVVLQDVRDARAVADVCDIALGVTPLEPCLNVHPSHNCIGGQRRDARARCAEILNARSAP